MMLASECRMSKRRVMAKSKVYGFSPWVDQVDAINHMKDIGERNESSVLRKLVDEALDARRKERKSIPVFEESDAGGRLKTIETLLMRLVRQANISFRIEDVCLVLLQDILAETYATHRIS